MSSGEYEAVSQYAYNKNWGEGKMSDFAGITASSQVGQG